MIERTCLTFTLIAGLAAQAMSQTVTEMPLWDGDPAVAADSIGDYVDRPVDGKRNRWLTGVEHPVVTVRRADPDTATGAAVVVFPGGGYGGTAIDKEGHFVGDWLAKRGVTTMVVPYRCGGGEHQHPVPLADAKHAVRLTRSNAAAWGVDPAKIGVLGFSAGGHLTASAATMYDDELEGIDDPLSEVSARPDFAVLVYPVISMRDRITHAGSQHNLLGDNPSDELVAHMSADERVSADTPPTLLLHSADDGAVPVANSLRFFEACQKNGVPAEIHVYETGGHGYGMWPSSGSVANWPHLLEGWLVARGLAVAAD